MLLPQLGVVRTRRLERHASYPSWTTPPAQKDTCKQVVLHIKPTPARPNLIRQRLSDCVDDSRLKWDRVHMPWHLTLKTKELEHTDVNSVPKRSIPRRLCRSVAPVSAPEAPGRRIQRT